MARYKYLLGDSGTEAARLRRQAALWDPTAHALFDRLGVRPSWRVLEIGPGQGSLHLELRRRTRGRVDAVEPSAAFAARLEHLCRRQPWPPGRFWTVPLLDAPLPEGAYDLVFARWVFLFLPDPLAHLKKLVRVLKPGGRLAIEDYHRDTLALVPRPPEWPAFMAADRAFFASQGGDVSIGSRLPELYRRAGLEVVDVTPTVKTGRPGSAVWSWLSDYFLGVMDRYGAFPPFSPAQAGRLSRTWREAARSTASLLIAPAVLDVVGRKVKTPRRA